MIDQATRERVYEAHRALKTGSLLGLKAAERNAHKGGPDSWRRPPLGVLADKILEEAHELAEALLEGDPEGIREEYGDLVWSATQALDRDGLLGEWGRNE